MGASAALWTAAVGAVIAAHLHPPLAGPARAIALCAAFWMAILGYLERGGVPGSGVRFVAALALAAASAHLGWALLHPDGVMTRPRALLNPMLGHSALFVPLGILVLTPRMRAARERYLAAALGSLPRALAVARLGCIAAGCCRGADALVGAHPARLYEIAGLLGLAGLTRRLPDAWVAPSTLFGFGALRLATGPFRAPPPSGEPLIAPGALALGWIAVAAALGALAAVRQRPGVGLP